MSSRALEHFDLPGHIDIAIGSVRSLRGIPAAVTAAIFAAIALRLAPEVWYYDLQPTAAYIGDTDSLRSLPGYLALIAPLIGWLSFLLPTLLEVGLSRLATAGIKQAEWIVYIASGFDAFTDWPRVVQTMDAPGVWAFFVTHFGAFAGLAWAAARIALLFMATIGFEALFAIAVAVAIVCVYNAVRGGSGKSASFGRP